MFSNGELLHIYRSNFIMMNDYNYDINILENMIPFEREIYVLMLLNDIDKKQKTAN